VQQSVVVEVEKDGGLRVSDVRESGLRGDVFEGAVALVAEEDVAAARAGDEEVEVAVVVVIHEGGGDAHAIAEADAGFVGDFLEGAVAVIAAQGVAAELIAEIDVVVAVAVEIADRQTATVIVKVDLEGFALLIGQERHAELQADLVGAFTKRMRGSIRGRRCPRSITLANDPSGHSHNYNADKHDEEFGALGHCLSLSLKN